MSQPHSNISSVKQTTTKTQQLFFFKDKLSKNQVILTSNNSCVFKFTARNSHWASFRWLRTAWKGRVHICPTARHSKYDDTHARHTSGVSHQHHYFLFLYPYILLSLSEFLKVIHSLLPLFWHSPSFSPLSATPGRLTAATPPCLPKPLRRFLSHTHSPFLSISPSPLQPSDRESYSSPAIAHSTPPTSAYITWFNLKYLCPNCQASLSTLLSSLNISSVLLFCSDGIQ